MSKTALLPPEPQVAQLPWHKQLQQSLQQRRDAGLYRQTRQRQGEQSVEVVVDGQSFLSFTSNDYLGLASHPDVRAAFIKVASEEGVGSGAAHLLTGHSVHHQHLEEQLAVFCQQEAVLLFSTGYMANIGVIDALTGRNDVVIQDKLNHASLLDGGRLSEARQWRYAHNDMQQLHRRLHQTSDAGQRLIVSDGVFSMDGDLAPLPEIMALAQQHRTAVLIDDAHAIGVLGSQGRGSVEHWQLEPASYPIVVGTFGKAFGTAGAFVAADEVVIETLRQHARSYVYTTAQPAAIAAATSVSLRLLQAESWRREKLQALIEQFRRGAEQLGLPLMDSQTAIQPVLMDNEHQALAVGQSLEQQGILVGVIRPPTVPAGSARLRITFSALHQSEHVDRLLSALEQACAH
ncbi:8-amino-7-oxononanoate synthase [Methylophaga lonarensis MPL]|uniref:8-amino-7-oxononanoate synthase n=1 Tax=Methylophaga lonarensis MPL TaxID=1286106 RepID=M7PH48_9GAMM|nr:8-amino-7-oxononanoate synthase [Methylophaga lonarensis]EMR13220.1 8-amino-7-oxononanoate synthase [Methylophaga lonarensis MPL]